MLTEEEISVLRQIREGRDPANADHAGAVLAKGYIGHIDGKYHLTEHGENELRVLPGYGEALVDILIPGATTEDAVDAAVKAEASRERVEDGDRNDHNDR